MKALNSLTSRIAMKLFPVWWKRRSEMRFWMKQKRKEETLTNKHYIYPYTTHFGLTVNSYAGKRILDIGCGPRGSLEWAETANQRVGLDPLADEYLKIGADQHAMEYVSEKSEQMPFDDGSFDIVCAFNSLDHVEDVLETISEIKRVTTNGGMFLLLVEINHPPTATEPHNLSVDVLNQFDPEFSVEDFSVFKPVEGFGVYRAIRANNRWADPTNVTEAGWLSAKLRRN